MSEENLRKSIYQNFNFKETDQLIQIWQENKRDEWSDAAFEVIQQILEERGINVPPQIDPRYVPDDEQGKEDSDAETIMNTITDSENQPVFYKPQKLIFFADATSKAAWVILAINVAFTAWQYFRYFFITNDLDFLPLELGITFSTMMLQMTGHTLTFFLLKGISMGLYVLMEFEFNSRGVQ